MGDYGSPQVMGASGEATAPMVAVLADQGDCQVEPGSVLRARLHVIKTLLMSMSMSNAENRYSYS